MRSKGAPVCSCAAFNAHLCLMYSYKLMALSLILALGPTTLIRTIQILMHKKVFSCMQALV